jgi:fucose 4-O-acetylase-like acetyltransferase
LKNYEKSDKLSAILNLQTFGILLVVLGHSVPRSSVLHASPPYPDYIIWMHNFIYSFHMPLFMFLSGYLFVHSTRDREIQYINFIGKKVTRLLIPYIVLSTLAFLPKVILTKYAARPIELTCTSYIRGLIFPSENPIIAMWFLPVLFSIFLVAPLLKKIIDKNRLFITLTALAALAALNIFNPVDAKIFAAGITAEYIVYFFLGCVIAKLFKENLNWCGKIHYVLITFTALLMANIFLPQLTVKLPAFLAAIIGICFSITLAYFMENHGRKFFGYIDGYSYQIYLLSWFAQIFFRILYQTNLINEYICFALMLASGLIVPVLISKLVEKKLPVLKIFIGLR